MIRIAYRWAGWLFLLTLFFVNQWIEYKGTYIPFLYSYLDDLLVVPLALGAFHLWQIYVCKKGEDYPLPFPVLLFAVLGFSFHFEFLLPLFSEKYTSDIWDIAMYSTGGILYIVCFNRRRIFA